jgi:UDP-2-acetamido-3-amino-2,3-dideoxy-glucuronate N-acetyltransferase
MNGCSIGENCIIGQNVFIASNVVLGNNVKVQNNVSIYEGVLCEDDVFLGPSMVFTNVINPRSAVSRKNEYRQTIVRKGATIGANATVVCGNEIGQYAFIGAGAVVTKPVAAYAIVTGNPAKPTGWMSEKGYKLSFNEKGYAVCEGSCEEYFLNNGRVTRKN